MVMIIDNIDKHTLDCFLSISVTGKTGLTRLPDDAVVEGDFPPIVV